MNIERAHRLLRMLTLLRWGTSFCADRLARELNVSRRSVFRVPKLLESAGVPNRFEQFDRCYRPEAVRILENVRIAQREMQT